MVIYIIIGALAVLLVGALSYTLWLTDKKARTEKELEILNKSVENAVKSKKRIDKRNHDSIDTVRERLRKDARN